MRASHNFYFLFKLTHWPTRAQDINSANCCTRTHCAFLQHIHFAPDSRCRSISLINCVYVWYGCFAESARDVVHYVQRMRSLYCARCNSIMCVSDRFSHFHASCMLENVCVFNWKRCAASSLLVIFVYVPWDACEFLGLREAYIDDGNCQFGASTCDRAIRQSLYV